MIVLPHTDTLDQILAFTQRYPRSCFHTIDMPYRLCSPAAQDVANRRVWTNNEGEVVGFALAQLPFFMLDWAVRPGSEALQEEIVRWGVVRLAEVARQRNQGFGYLIDSRSETDAALLRQGFELDDWHIRNLEMSLTKTPSKPRTPAGFTIRPLAGESEVAAYVDLHRAAFNSRNMTIEWRARTLAHPTYQPKLDLVAQADDRCLAAFCIGWLGKIEGATVGQIEPLGVLPEFQRRGLGRALLLEAVNRFAQLGAKHLYIDAESYNSASQGLYESVGFVEKATTYKYFRRF